MLVKKESFHNSTSSDFEKGQRKILVSASILSIDFSNLQKATSEVKEAGADWLHIDVMDGNFVPNLTIGPVVISGIRKSTNMFLDVHLMIKSPLCHLKSVVDSGADMITVHAESDVHLSRFIKQVKSYGKKVGVSIVPKTHHSALEYIIQELDVVLVMSVDPGFGGQEFLTSQLRKIEKIREMIEHEALPTKIAVDGGVNVENAKSIVDAGADILVVGSALFASASMHDTVRALKSL